MLFPVYLVGMMRLAFFLVLSSFVLCAQEGFSQTAEEFEANYAKRIKEEMLNGVYIPVDLNDAFHELNRLSEQQGLITFKNAPEDSIRRKLHFGLGRWIMTNWGLEEGSRISHYFRLKGVTLPDDMVRIIIVTWHRSLNSRPLKLEEEIAIVKKRMDDEKVQREKDQKVIVIEKRPHKE